MSNITVLNTEFKNITELKKYTEAQYLALKSATDKIKQLEEEVQHLQQLLTSATQLIDPKVETILKSPELCIVEAQIDILQNRALQKELTLEEIKALDLLIKNKRLLMGDPTAIEGQKKKNKIKYTEAQLIHIAKKDIKPNG